MPGRSNHNHRVDLNGSRTTNTSANVSPSLNDNNSRTVLLGSDDIRSPLHHHHRRQRSANVHTDSTADYDEVASHSTVDDTTPHMSSETTSISEVPSESRFKTFVKQKKNKGLAKQANKNNNIHYNERNNHHQGAGSEDTDNEPAASLLHGEGVEVDDELGSTLAPKTNGTTNQNDKNNNQHNHIRGNGHIKPQEQQRIFNATGSANTDASDEHEEGDDDSGDDDDDDSDDSQTGNEVEHEEDEDEEEDEDDDDDEDDAEEGVYELGGGLQDSPVNNNG